MATTRACNTYLDEGTDVLVFHCSLASDLVKAASVGTVTHGLVLKIALASLVTDGAVQGMVGQQEFHDTLTSLVGKGGIGLDHHAGLDRPSTRGHRLRGSLDLHQAHTAVSSNHKLFVVAVSRNGDTSLLTGLNEGRAGFDGHLAAI